jgi:probable rRNA maturation factor
MIHLNIDADYRGLRLEKTLKKAAEAVLIQQGITAGEISVVITSDQRLKTLNKQFRGIDETTDVLSFPSEAMADNDLPYYGDVIISLPHARAQAEAAHHPLKDELQLLVVHGVLHLLGHDHEKRSSKAKMWAAQRSILHDLGIDIDVDESVASHSKA